MQCDAQQPRVIQDLLAEQGRMTVVEKFAHAHGDERSAPRSRYRDLIPLSLPPAGQQFAFEVDLDKCSGCKACVTACHALNGLDEGEAWRETGLLVSDDWRHPFQQVVTTACHHCLDPACLTGCPVLAYEKDPLTGIVRHLDDQCIGCQYCILTCPYEVPKYSASRGIVRKCDMCSSRLLAGEAPACVQACPSDAIRITIVANDAIAPGFLPASPDPSITQPTTRYISQRSLPVSVKAADHETLRPQLAHWPLVFMLVLTQIGAGLYLFAFTFGTSRFELYAALICLSAGLVASVLHLGRPRGAWRAFLGLRRSWLSREIVVFGLCLPLAIVYTFSANAFLGFLTVIIAMAGLFCSAMIYHQTRREYWALATTAPKFFGTACLLGALAQMMTLRFPREPADAPPLLWGLCAAIAAVAFCIKLAAEERVIDSLAKDDFSQLHKTALLLSGHFVLLRRIRIACGIVGAVCLPALLALVGPTAPSSFALVAAALILCFAGELIERWLFFVAVQPAKMPG